MEDKFFNLFDEYPSRCIHFTHLSGKRGASWSEPTETNKSGVIAKIRVLVE